MHKCNNTKTHINVLTCTSSIFQPELSEKTAQGFSGGFFCTSQSEIVWGIFLSSCDQCSQNYERLLAPSSSLPLKHKKGSNLLKCRNLNPKSIISMIEKQNTFFYWCWIGLFEQAKVQQLVLSWSSSFFLLFWVCDFDGRVEDWMRFQWIHL